MGVKDVRSLRSRGEVELELEQERSWDWGLGPRLQEQAGLVSVEGKKGVVPAVAPLA